MSSFEIIKDFTYPVKKFNLNGRKVEFKIKRKPASEEEPSSWVKNAITDVILHATKELDPSDMVSFDFCSTNFAKGNGWFRFQRANEVSVEDVWNVIASIFQSNGSALDTDKFCLGVTSVHMPAGKGREKNYNDFQEECIKRKGIINIENNDNMCLPRAIVVAIASIDKDPEYRKILKNTRKMQTQKANKFIKDINMVIPDEGAGISELQQAQQHLKDKYQIKVFKHGTKGRELIFKGPEAPAKINLLHHDGHYNVIRSLTAAFACTYFCEICCIPYNNKDAHRCSGSCSSCQQSPPCRRETKINCQDCNREFRSQTCFDNHKKEISKKILCNDVKRCTLCLKTVKNNRQHVCGEIYCKICQKHVPGDHLCYMQVDKGVPKHEGFLFIFYDLETQQEKMDGDTKIHEPNLCVLQQRCDQCLTHDDNYKLCSKCGVRQIILKTNPIEMLMQFILNQRKLFKKVVCMAHNGQAFDHQFLLKHIIEKTDLTPELITRGTKLVVMQIGNVKFLDSINYFPMALSKLPKAFGLTELKKGYFPHLFNKKENENYVGPLPETQYYSPDTMRSEDRDTFLEWYEDHKNDEFNMQRDIVEYCISDVQILTQACMRFRNLFIEEGNVCPFTEAATLPGACNKIFRRNFLKPNTIGLIPKNGYRRRDNQSKIGTQWLIWLERQHGIDIIHAAKEKEVMLAGVYVDGYCTATNQVFEFHGCYYHGCPTCITEGRDKPNHDNPSETMESRYSATLAKSQRLRELGYDVVEKWECEFRRELGKNAEMKKYTEKHPLLVNLPLNPRDSFYGGRTDATKLYYEAGLGEKIKYADVCSLYPYICKQGKFPIGHPNIYVGEECNTLNLGETDGLIKCKILPPQNLYHALLPVKMNEKLIFTLCRTCAEECNSESECHHNEEERVLYGTWVIDEVNKALSLGYQLLQIYEIWQYEVEQYDAETKSGGLFTQYIDKFLKIKQQASGWPENCKTSEERQQYIQEYHEKEGVQLKFEEIEKNPALRQLGKAVITSFWGKMGQRENQSKTSIVNEPAQFFKMLKDPAIYVNTILPVNEETLIVNWELREEAYDILPTVNVCIAAYTTAQARLKLYSYLEKLGERVLYHDTDSVIYVSREKSEYDVPLGNMLGEMTDELECYGPASYITKFASGGPKLYAYMVYSPSKDEYTEICKVKGICINHTVSKDVNFPKLRDMILKDEPPVYITGQKIRRTATHDVVTKEETKVFRSCFTKRKRVEDFDSVPFGFKRPRKM